VGEVWEQVKMNMVPMPANSAWAKFGNFSIIWVSEKPTQRMTSKQA
jgi:hypothetical protein